MKSSEETRERLIAYVNVARSLLSINPKASLHGISRQVGCSARVGPELVAIGAIKANDAGHAFADTRKPDEIVDALILHRRETASASPEVECKRLRAELGELQLAHADIVNRLSALEAAPQGLSAEDTQLINLALSDDKNRAARFEQLERSVGEALRQLAALAKPMPHAVSGEDLPLSGPERTRLLRIGILGVYKDAMRYLYEGVARRVPKGVTIDLVHVDHVARDAVIPAGLDAFITTNDAARRAPDVRAKYPTSCYAATSGRSNIIDTILLIAGKPANAAAA